LPEADYAQPAFALRRKDDSIWLEHSECGPVHLGAYDTVCDELCRFLEEEEFGD
jgi:hypothetical protein